ncbi:hypothetical protein FACS1894200_14140 [Spirochaetia bacterium]|nr:hypothetical protein FACS1894200_14140 [Spirochaetia bacterium]
MRLNSYPPTQIVAIASRIALSEVERKTERKISYQRKLKVGDFQRQIKKKNFKDKLKELIGEKGQLADVFKTAIAILTLKQHSDLKFPRVLARDFVKNSSEIFFFFVYWLYENKEDFKNTLEEQLKIVAKLLYFSWFSAPKTSVKMVKALWESGEITKKRFWRESITHLTQRMALIFASNLD